MKKLSGTHDNSEADVKPVVSSSEDLAAPPLPPPPVSLPALAVAPENRTTVLGEPVPDAQTWTPSEAPPVATTAGPAPAELPLASEPTLLSRSSPPPQSVTGSVDNTSATLAAPQPTLDVAADSKADTDALVWGINPIDDYHLEKQIGEGTFGQVCIFKIYAN